MRPWLLPWRPLSRRRRVAADGPLDEERLLWRYHSDGDLDARESLVLRLMPLARQLASRYRHAGEPLEDLVQVACVGLLKAIDRYDPERGAGFARYAVPTMLGEIKRHFRDKGWAVRVPRATQELALKVSDALGTLPAKLGRAARPRDVAEVVGASVEEVLEAMEAATAYDATSLDAPRPGASTTPTGASAMPSPTTKRAMRSSRSARRCAGPWTRCPPASA